MVAKLNCMAAPDQAFAPGAHVPGGSSAHHTTSSTRTPVHYGEAISNFVVIEVENNCCVPYRNQILLSFLVVLSKVITDLPI